MSVSAPPRGDRDSIDAVDHKDDRNAATGVARRESSKRAEIDGDPRGRFDAYPTIQQIVKEFFGKAQQKASIPTRWSLSVQLIQGGVLTGEVKDVLTARRDAVAGIETLEA